MKKLIPTLLLLCFVISLNAQDRFTYIEDRVFHTYNDMLGYKFVPNGMEIPHEYDEDLSAGEYSFGITRANLYVDGGELKGVYNVNQADQQPYGYKLALMNARNPTSQGHLKIIVNKNKHVDALIFKKDRNEKEIIFFLGETPERLAVKEEKYFTDKFEIEIEETDSIWNQTIQPFFSMTKRSQDRLEINDSTTISFVETIKITEKKKRGKKNKKEEKEEEEELTEEEQLMEEDKMAMKALGLETDEEEEKDVKLKIDKSYFIEIKEKVKYEDGVVEHVVTNYPIKKVVEREDTHAGPEENRYELDFTTIKGDHIFLYLTGKRTIASMKFVDRKFLMRGN